MKQAEDNSRNITVSSNISAIKMEVVADVYQHQQQTKQQSQRNVQSTTTTQTRPYSNAERQRRYREKRKADKMNARKLSQSDDVQTQQEQPQHDVQINKPLSNAERQRKYRKLLREQKQQQKMEDLTASNSPQTSSIRQVKNVDQAENARKRHLNKLRQSRFRARQRFESPSTSSHQAQTERFPPVTSASRDKWIRYVQVDRRQENWFPSGASKLCSKHFRKEDIVIGKSGRSFLKKGAFPFDLSENVYSKEDILSQLQGKTIVEMDHFYKRLQEVASHGSLPGCNLSSVQIVDKDDIGILSTLHMQCRTCLRMFTVKSCKENEESVPTDKESFAVKREIVSDEYDETHNDAEATGELVLLNEKLVQVKKEFANEEYDETHNTAEVNGEMLLLNEAFVPVKKEFADEEYDGTHNTAEVTRELALLNEELVPVKKEFANEVCNDTNEAVGVPSEELVTVNKGLVTVKKEVSEEYDTNKVGVIREFVAVKEEFDEDQSCLNDTLS